MGGDITGLSSMATRGLLSALAAEYEADTGRTVAVRSMGGVEAARLVREAEPVDVIVLASGVVEALEREGYVRPGSRRDVVRSHVALAVPDGAPSPDIADEAALREAILSAPAIHYSTGPSGDQLKRLLARWGIAERVADRLLQAPPGVPVGSRLAQGGTGVGVQQLSELTGVPGITVVGPLPATLGASTVFSIGIGAKARAIDAAHAFHEYVVSTRTRATRREFLFDPL